MEEVKVEDEEGEEGDGVAVEVVVVVSTEVGEIRVMTSPSSWKA